MHNIRKITEDLIYIGANDRRISRFENQHPVPNGMSYNSYLLLDEKTVLLDTVDKAVGDLFLENLHAALKGRALDYMIIQHMEPDHCALIPRIIELYPQVTVVGSQKTFGMIQQFFGLDLAERAMVMKEGDTLQTGAHTLRFLMAPMVHWPEVMVTYDETSKWLFSADAFGAFGAINGNLYADEYDVDFDLMPEVRRYYTNIVGKYGRQVLALLEKIAKLDIQMILSLHGPILRQDMHYYIDKYSKWASYTPEEKGIVIAYGSIYGNTEKAAELLAAKLADRGEKNIVVYDLSAWHFSYILSECFRFDRLVFASSTYNMEIFPPMENLLLELKGHNMQNRAVAVIENGTWAPQSGKKMRQLLAEMKDMRVLESEITIKSAMTPADDKALDDLVELIIAA
ncbi:MAG TPA: FprA family A-type flavoprotein [Anaerolineaceae bacterium]|nr:FprA family A-type flavoprotein [Anaerolineaceae bacterium]HQJ32282.1 FprA family A-type flavoprotein [Anaerolineaceae bacterium]